MPTKSLNTQGAWVFTPQIFEDTRGIFYEWFQQSTYCEQSGTAFELVQANCSVSSKGVVRGIHFAGAPKGQRKYVTCVSGSIIDVIVDLRPNSDRFGKWEAIDLNPINRTVLSIPNGVGHSFVALEDNSTVMYLCDQNFNPNNEFGINPLDPTIGITWPSNLDLIFSDRDINAPSFKEMSEVLNGFAS